MRTHTMRTTKAPHRGADAGRRRLLGLAMLLLTLGGGYAIAQRGAVPSPVALVQFAGDADAAEDSDAGDVVPSRPTTAEIMAHIEEVAARRRGGARGGVPLARRPAVSADAALRHPRAAPLRSGGRARGGRAHLRTAPDRGGAGGGHAGRLARLAAAARASHCAGPVARAGDGALGFGPGPRHQ